jgi:hypothetical protein
MNTSNGNKPRKVIIKTMTVNRGVDDVFNFFENVKNMEIGGAIKSVTKGEDGWWTFEHIVSGKSKIRSERTGSLEFSTKYCRRGNRMECIC